MDKSLDYLIKGDIVKVDIFKVLIDQESDKDIDKSELPKHLKYGVKEASFGREPKIN